MISVREVNIVVSLVLRWVTGGVWGIPSHSPGGIPAETRDFAVAQQDSLERQPLLGSWRGKEDPQSFRRYYADHSVTHWSVPDPL